MFIITYKHDILKGVVFFSFFFFFGELYADGTSGTFKEKVELDDVNKSVTLVGLEGDVFQEYKSFKAIHHAVPKGNGCLAKLSIEYEKLNPNVPPPNKYLNMVAQIAKDIDAHIQKA